MGERFYAAVLLSRRSGAAIHGLAPGGHSIHISVWDATRLKVQQKADEWRRQGFIGPTMASHAELAYTGIIDTLSALDREFTLRHDATLEPAEREPVMSR